MAHVKKGKLLTDKQEAFCLAYIETGNAAESYRRAYEVSPSKQSAKWIYVEASQLLDHPGVAIRLQELKDEAKKLSLYSVSEAFDEYEEARRMAMSSDNPSGAVAAVNGKVKLFGLDQPTKHDLTSSDGSMTPLPAMVEFVAPDVEADE